MRPLVRRFLPALTVALAAVASVSAQDGFTPLVKGDSLAGWTVINGKAPYVAKDGVVTGTTAKGSPNSFLASERFYGDFDLRFDVKLHDDRLNSGVQVRSHSLPSYKDGRFHGYQVEIATGGGAGFVYDEARRGWLSQERDDPKKTGAFRAGGEWNSYRILCEGNRIRTWVNDVPVADLEDDWSATGRIGLQVHSVQGDPKWQVSWRNLRIKELGDGGGWASLFDGRSLDGWTVNENRESVKVQDGAIVVGGPRAHAFYTGPVQNADFENFVFEAEVKTAKNANSGVYFHTRPQDSGWPAHGYEVQVNNSHGDWRRTGGLYAVQDVREAPAKDGEWFRLRIEVRGDHVVVKVNDEVTADYTEPEEVERPRGMEHRVLARGTFALQCHDPGSVVHFRKLRVKALP